MFKTIITSTVIAAVVSGIVSLAISHIQYKNSLELNRYNRKWDLSLEAFKNLQSALEKINQNNEIPKSENIENPNDDFISALIVMFSRSKDTMNVLKSTLEQIMYLIPEEKVTYYEKKISDLEESYKILLASAYHYKGVPASTFKVDLISVDDIAEGMDNFIQQTEELSKELKSVIVSTLRYLFNT